MIYKRSLSRLSCPSSIHPDTKRLSNALDDPFLASGCYPVQETSNHKHVYLEMPGSGGHLGFIQFNKDKSYWSERRAIEFLQQS